MEISQVTGHVQLLDSAADLMQQSTTCILTSLLPALN